MTRMSPAALKTTKLLPLLLSCSILHSALAQQTNSTSSNIESSGKRENVHIPDYIYDLYDKVKLYGFDYFTKNKTTETVNVIRHHYDEGDEYENDPENGFMLKFNLTNVPIEEAMRASQLSVHLGLPKAGEEYIGEVYDVLEPTKPTLRLIDTTAVNTGNMTSQWLSFDVMPAISRTMKQTGDKIVHLYVKARTLQKKSNLRVRKSTIVNDDQHRAYLLTFTDDGSGDSQTTSPHEKQAQSVTSSRITRRSDGVDVKTESHCRRHPMYVKFADIDQDDWILAPVGYEAYRCEGKCVTGGKTLTNHAKIQHKVNSMKPDVVPKTCCAPTDLSSVPLLFLDPLKTLMMKPFQDMVVDRCGCR